MSDTDKDRIIALVKATTEALRKRRGKQQHDSGYLMECNATHHFRSRLLDNMGLDAKKVQTDEVEERVKAMIIADGIRSIAEWVSKDSKRYFMKLHPLMKGLIVEKDGLRNKLEELERKMQDVEAKLEPEFERLSFEQKVNIMNQ
jgi:predicted nuclease with TOPRIM domain